MSAFVQPTIQPTIPAAAKSKVVSKPTKSLEKFLQSYIARDLYRGDKLVRRAPRVIIKALKDIDAKSLKNGYQAKVKALKDKQDSLPPNDAEGRKSLQEQIDKVKKEEARLYENITVISKFDFIKEFEESNGDISKIYDPALRGYLAIIGNKIDKETFKRMIDKFGFAKSQTKNYPKILADMLKKDKYKMKIFNASFTHPDMKDKSGKVIMRKIKSKNSVGEEPMKLYLKRFCKHFEFVLNEVVKGSKSDSIIYTAMNEYAKEQKYQVNIQDIWVKAGAQIPGQKVKYDKPTRELIGVYNSVKSMIEELRQYPNLAAEYQTYAARIQQFESIKKMELRSADSISLLQSFCQIVKACEALRIDQFQDLVFNDFIHESGMKLKADIKKKLRECALSGQMIQQVEQQFETKELKVKDKETGKNKTKSVAKDMTLAANQFLKEDISILETVENVYDTDKYDRIGRIVEFKASKAWHVALALRLLKEIKYTIAEGQAKGQTQFVFAL